MNQVQRESRMSSDKRGKWDGPEEIQIQSS